MAAKTAFLFLLVALLAFPAVSAFNKECLLIDVCNCRLGLKRSTLIGM